MVRVEKVAPAERFLGLNWRIWLLLILVLALGLRLWGVDFGLPYLEHPDEARTWILGNLPAGSTLAMESYDPFLDTDAFQVVAMDFLSEHTPDWYRSSGVDYLIVSEGAYAPFYEDPIRYESQIAAYEALFDAFPLLRSFDEDGFEVRIYAVR